MADESKTPVAVRIMRPYGTEEEFLARELDTLTRTSIVLLGAQPRPQGVVLRFELALASGAPLVRGEGRVVAFKENAFDDLPGLTLRFTRLDSRSKALVDRAAAMRDARSRPAAPAAPTAPTARAPTMPPARPSARPSAQPVAPAAPLELDLEATRAEVPEAKQRSDRPPPPAVRPSSRPRPTASRPPMPPGVPPRAPSVPAMAIDLEATRAEAPQPKRASERPLASAPTDRDALLARLRDRRKSLDEDAVNALLAKKRNQ